MISFSLLLAEFAFRFLKDRPTTQIHLFACFARRRKQRAATSSSSGSSQLTAVDQTAGPIEVTHGWHPKLMLLSISVSTFFVFVRSVYRCPELLAGWNGPIIGASVAPALSLSPALR